MEQINKYRSPIVLGVLILFLLLFAFYMLGIQPDNKKIAATKSEISQLSLENGMLQTKIDKLKTSEVKDATQEAVMIALPRGDGSEQLILDLRNIEAKSYARIKDITFNVDDVNPIQEMTGSADVMFPTVKQIKMTAVIEGGYTEIYNWITRLQLLPRIVNVDSFSFQQPENQQVQSSGGILTANISFTAYYEEIPTEQK
ncbi:type 4a pilus biogenesis protein PilO [Paenibacillus wynnii]|uniref:Pilus assembly protein PilO n=1 Tax=Paenibacillus wynnii TaxID=268407 RepID=A0A098MEG5_9BACL|nr:type 4a pilus biogenesis protein PilO [Paenibacillus wynnii]KGE20438.1 hypothetical protein PWYN_14630 [Paenibacillus wynnii]